MPQGKSQSTAPLRLGIAGLGTVGASVMRILARRSSALTAELGRPVTVVAATARDRTKDRGVDLSGVTWFDTPEALAAADIDCLVELVGGADGPAKRAVEIALGAGKSVITANKAMLAAHGRSLAVLAEKSGASLRYEAAAAGGIPVIKTLREALGGNEITRISGILNGTCNYMLSRMELEGLDYATCLREAQRLGYAEAEPSFDVDGFDTAHKLSILTSLAFGTAIDADAISVEGISRVDPLDLAMAEEFGYRIKLLGVAERIGTAVEQRVHPTMVPRTAPLAQVMGVTNAVTIESDALGALTLIGAGAGGNATASAVIGDICDVARGTGGPVFRLRNEALVPLTPAAEIRNEGGFYTRLTVLDRRGAFAAIASRMAEQNISIESIVQKGAPRQRTVPVILITHATTPDKVKAALAAVAADGVLDGPPNLMRINR
jgi:homoserine dehydrogenase